MAAKFGPITTAYPSSRSWQTVIGLCLCACLAAAGCEGPIEERGEGPGHRSQALALNPRQEIEIGRRAYREILSKPEKFGRVLPDDAPESERVREVASRIVKATEIRPLMREMNLHPGRFDWEIHVFESPQINAFCLPGGKIAVFTGLLQVVRNDDQLATVIAHETAHALAHHVSERIAQSQNGGSVLGMLRGKAFDRDQEAEADHIGIFLMTFAGYNPEEAVRFWQHMEQISAARPRLPEILSDHPSDERRLRNIESWVPRALAAKKAFEEGHIEPDSQARRGVAAAGAWSLASGSGSRSCALRNAARISTSTFPAETLR